MSTNRWFRRTLRLCIIGSIVAALLAAGGTWWAHQHLTRLVVEAINRTYPQLRLSAQTVAFTPTGDIELKAVRLRVRSDGSEVLFIPSAHVRSSWRELRENFIREIFVDHPKIMVNDTLLAGLAEGTNAAAGPPWRVGRLAVVGGRASLDLAAAPLVRLGFDLHLTESGVASENIIALNSIRVRAREDADDALTISALRVRASAEDLRQQRIREILIDQPQLQLTDRVLALLPKSSSEPAAELPWRIERVSVQGGKAVLDLAGFPRADFSFAAQVRDLAPDGGGAADLSLTGLSVRWREADVEVLSLSSVHVVATVGGLRNRIIREIEVEDPHVNVTDRLLAWSPPHEAPAVSQTAAPAPWSIDKLAIKRGRARVDLAGAPLAECSFGARLHDATLTPEGTGELQSAEVLDLALRLRGAELEPFLRVPAIRAEFRLPELLRARRLARLRIEHLDLRYNAPFRDMIASGAKPELPATPSGKSGPPFTIGELRLTDGRIHLDDLGLGIPGIECRLETAFREIALAPDAGQGGHELQTIELSRIALSSPLDPFFTVLNLDTVFIRFTLAGLWKREIDEVAIVRPTLAIGPDLFWYIDRVQKNQSANAEAAAAPAATGPDWLIRQFSAKSGQLVLALEGQAQLALPMPFESHAEQLSFRRLSDLRLKLSIDMPVQDYEYPGYELSMRGVSGRVEFSLPPAKGANNVVNTLRMKEVRWKNFLGREFFLDVTYDERGVYGKLAGKGYTGLVNGQFNCLLAPESPWNGWISGSHIDLEPITNALAPEKFSLTGPADFRLTVAAHASEILNVKGDFKSRRAGQLRIGKLDDLIKGLPGDWTGVKRGLSRISLETMRDFAYDTAHGDFQFFGLTGAVRLDLRGSGGSRKIEMNFHEGASPEAAGRVAASRP